MIKPVILVRHLKQANYGDQNDNEKGRKVRLRNDAIKSQLWRLQKIKKDLFRQLDDIVQGFSEEEEKFHLLCQEIGVYTSTGSMTNVTGTVNESFA